MNEILTGMFWFGRARMAIIFAILILGFLVASSSGLFSEYAASALTKSVWLLASIGAAVACFLASYPRDAHDRTAWLIMATACSLWAFGHAMWIYFPFVVHVVPRIPHWTQIFFLIYPLLFAYGLLRLPKPPEASARTLRHAGNLALIGCALVASNVVALWEPTIRVGRNWQANAVMFGTGGVLAIMCMTALYLLWSYRWRSTYWPLVLIALGSGIQTVTHIMNDRLRMTDNYSAESWYNVSWLLGFGAIACAAYERAWQRKHVAIRTQQALLARERWLEATVPALLIIIMLVAVWLSTAWLTTRVATIATVFAVVFAIVLSVRDAWIQRDEQRLLAELNGSNENLLAANRELVAGELRYRALNAELEKRVAERTTELQSAYRELESFSYAVAHDIKAPLRAVNSFASLLVEEHGKQLNENALGYVERMRRGALHLSQLVDDLLAYARVERQDLQLQATNLGAIIDDCIAEQREDLSRFKANVDSNVEAIVVRVDRAAFALTIRNLLQNALKFSGHARPPRIAIKTLRSADKIQIAVTDNGIGFDMQYHDRIFALFQRLHRPGEYPGTGIGLAIARKAIERMGGRMWAQSAIDQGATFYVELPLVSQENAD